MPSPSKKARKEEREEATRRQQKQSSMMAVDADDGADDTIDNDAGDAEDDDQRPFKQQLIDALCTRLRDPRSPEAADAPLRASLQPLEEEMSAVLGHAVAEGQNVSMLVIGEPGSGKTLVRFFGGEGETTWRR